MDVLGWQDAEIRHTHVSVVALTPTRVLKRKRPVDHGFLDFRSLEARHDACVQEARINERTAPGITLGVRRLTEHPDGLEVDGDGPTVDYAVEMVRLPDPRRLESMLEHDQLTPSHIDAVASWLADFHRACPSTTEHGGPATMAWLVEENFNQLLAADALIGKGHADATRAHLRSVLRTDAIARRQHNGHVRDGHGDLRLDHVYLLGDLDRPRVIAIDGLEFSPTYRCLDAASEVAFLAMGLQLHRRPRLAERLIARWASELDDWSAYEVVDFYVAYRAWVRAKVSVLQGDFDAAARLLTVARDAARTEPHPMVIAVGGPIAAGKSTVADALSFELGAPHLQTDRLRKQHAGVARTTSLGTAPFEGAYSHAATHGVYQALMDRAHPVLTSGRSVVLDGTFGRPELHAMARTLATEAGVPCRFVSCTAPVPVLRERLVQREDAPGLSDARAPLLPDFLRCYVPPAGPDTLTIDTSDRVDIRRLVEALELTSSSVAGMRT